MKSTIPNCLIYEVGVSTNVSVLVDKCGLVVPNISALAVVGASDGFWFVVVISWDDVIPMIDVVSNISASVVVGPSVVFRFVVGISWDDVMSILDVVSEKQIKHQIITRVIMTS